MSGVAAAARPAAPAPIAGARSRAADFRLIALLLLVPAAASAVFVTLASEHIVHPGFRSAYVSVAIVAPVLIGVAWSVRRPDSRTGLLLVALAGATWVTAWQAADDPIAFVVGIAAEPALAFITLLIALTFPSGRVVARRDRTTLLAWAVVLALAWTGVLAFVSDLGPAGPLAACEPVCPPNPLSSTALAPATLQFAWLLLALACAIVLGSAVWSLTRRFRQSSAAAGRELLPVYAVTVLYVAAFALHHAARFVGPPPVLADIAEAALVVVRLCFPFAALIALLGSELFAVQASRRLAAGLSSPVSATDIEQRLARAVHDPMLTLGVWSARDHHYVRSDHEQLRRTETADGRMWISVRDNGERLAALMTDDGFRATPHLVDALTTAALIEVRALVATQQTEALRARAVELADSERRRIARDLHDSAQQRLVALRIHMMLALEQMGPDHAERVVADRLSGELDLAIAELRDLARRFLGPAALADGIVPALRSLSEALPIRVTVRARGLRRHPPDAELAVYNCCLEAVQNSADHAGPSASVVVRLVERFGGIHFVVADDGVGFDPAITERGGGLTRITDRAVLAGGRASIKSAPGHGVRICGFIPTSAALNAA